MNEAVTLEEVGKTQSRASTGVESGRKNRAVKAKAPNPAVMTPDFQRLMETFTNELKLAVPCDGIEYRDDETGQHFVSGVLDHYLCCFEIIVGQKSFGNIYFARASRFLDPELSILENMVAGLMLPLCHLLQAEISHEKILDSDGNEQISESAAVHERQI